MTATKTTKRRCESATGSHRRNAFAFASRCLFEARAHDFDRPECRCSFKRENSRRNKQNSASTRRFGCFVPHLQSRDECLTLKDGGARQKNSWALRLFVAADVKKKKKKKCGADGLPQNFAGADVSAHRTPNG